MLYHQKDLVRLNNPIEMPDGLILDHPILIVSCDAANSRESHYTGIMMSATEHRDMFTFDVDNEMFEANLGKDKCQLRLKILVSMREVDIKKMVNKMKPFHFKVVVKQMKDYVFAID